MAVWKKAVPLLREKGYRRTNEQLSNRYTYLKQRWKERKFLEGLSGAGLDPHNNCITLPDQVWADLKEKWPRKQYIWHRSHALKDLRLLDLLLRQQNMATGRTATSIRRLAHSYRAGNSQIATLDDSSLDALISVATSPTRKRKKQSAVDESIEQNPSEQPTKKKRLDNRKKGNKQGLEGILDALNKPISFEPININPSAELLYWVEALEVWRKEFSGMPMHMTLAVRDYWQENPMKAKGFTVATPEERRYEVRELKKKLKVETKGENNVIKQEPKEEEVIVLLSSSDIESNDNEDW